MGNIDFDALKEHFDLLTEVGKDCGEGRQSGRWVLFSCPFPGHKNGDHNPSLAVTPDNGRYHCFACGQSGDVLTWLVDYRKMTWKDITDLAGGVTQPTPTARKVQPQPQPQPSGPPPAIWQARGLAFVDYCERQLWGDPGANHKVFGDLSPLEYLHQKRGLTDKTIKYYRLGYNPRGAHDPFASWGLPGDPGKKGVWLDPGITIPWLIGGALWGVNIRRPAGDPKYRKVAGSQAALFGADSLRGAEIVLLTEGELDCILCDQEIGDVAGVATLGSATKRLDVATWGHVLLPARAILAAYDLDPAGRAGLTALARATHIHAVRVPALRPGDKDITDYHQAGGDLWQWLKHNLNRLGVLQALGVLCDA